MSKQKLQSELERRLGEVSLSEVSKEVSEFLRGKRELVAASYQEWFFNSSQEEKALRNKVCLYQDRYFADMTLKKYARELMKINLEKGQSYIRTDIINDLYNALPGEWRFAVVPDTPEWCGVCYPDDRCIEITKSHRNNKSTILHEMIHAYDALLSPYPWYKEWLMLRLYRDLSRKIPEIDTYLSRDAHPDIVIDVLHGTLFALKSLDLDLRLKKPLGTIYDYGRDDLFK